MFRLITECALGVAEAIFCKVLVNKLTLPCNRIIGILGSLVPSNGLEDYLIIVTHPNPSQKNVLTYIERTT